tara:strand:- start:968 stop:1279 length:312 start_codon:yes stop_codon:yes gene_type:complete
MKVKLIFLLIFNLLLFNKTFSDEKFDKGKVVFLEQGNCAVCHTLRNAGSNGNIGPNLNIIKPNLMRVISVVTNGIGIMPAYQGELTLEEIESVAYYVSEASLN